MTGKERYSAGGEASPARLYALVVGAALVLGGIGGTFYESSFGTGADLVSDEILGTFATNGWDNALHMLAGVAGLGAASRAPRSYALAAGLSFTAVAIWGFTATDRGVGNLLELLPVSSADNVLHLTIGVSGLAAALFGGPLPSALSSLRVPGVRRGGGSRRRRLDATRSRPAASDDSQMPDSE